MITSDAKLKEINKKLDILVSDVFRDNAGMSGMIFNKHHPYFDVPEKYKKLARKNFNLLIPEKD